MSTPTGAPATTDACERFWRKGSATDLRCSTFIAALAADVQVGHAFLSSQSWGTAWGRRLQHNAGQPITGRSV